MMTDKDTQQINKMGMTTEQIRQQLKNFEDGFPPLDVQKAATINDGIIRYSDEEMNKMATYYEEQLNKISVSKFVPASGAATRMFKFLFELYNQYDENKDDLESIIKADESLNYFFSNIASFPFYEDLQNVLQKHHLSVEQLIDNKQYNTLIHYFLYEDGLNYGHLPKALIKFHKYNNHSRTPLEDHLIEGAMYGKYNNGIVNVHFTALADHKKLFNQLINTIHKRYEKYFKAKYNIAVSIQDPATNTIAVDPSNQPFRQSNGEMLFRPGGHGALLQNLNNLKQDIVFIKNIDNIVPDRNKDMLVHYKKALGGVLMHYVHQIHNYLVQLENPRNITDALLNEILDFTKNELCIIPPEGFDPKERDLTINYLFQKLNRPVRVGGMVKAHGDTGGGPFWARNPDGTISLQIAETKQLDLDNPKVQELYKHATHFNPTDFACYIKDFKGNKFDLNRFIDPNTGFITHKSAEGYTIKAQELPGLWNGGMSEWNTIFVEVPYETFNPVKTINDLLNEEHLT